MVETERASAVDFNKANVLKTSDRLPNRRPPETERFSNLTFGNHPARLKRAVDDHFFDRR
jgi:hypothetical protein